VLVLDTISRKMSRICVWHRNSVSANTRLRTDIISHEPHPGVVHAQYLPFAYTTSQSTSACQSIHCNITLRYNSINIGL